MPDTLITGPRFTDHDILMRIIHRDDLIIVLDKPHGIAVHAGPSGGYSLEDHFADLMFGYKEKPHLAHRLDRDTSGCLILGRNQRALKKLGKLFEAGQIKKTYWAITDRAPVADNGTIDTPLVKIKLNKGWSMQPAQKGQKDAQEAITHYKVIKRLPDGRAFLELTPETGRTHQLRVHLQSIKCPISGDWLYGDNKDRPETGQFPTLHLHARSLIIPLFPDRDPVTVTAEPPAHIANLIG